MVGQTSPDWCLFGPFPNILLPANFNNDDDHNFNVIAVKGDWVFLYYKSICYNNFEDVAQYLFELYRYTGALTHH